MNKSECANATLPPLLLRLLPRLASRDAEASKKLRGPRSTRIIFCCVVLSLGLWLSEAQSQPVQSESAESITLNIGRDNPFAKIFDKGTSVRQEVPQLSQSDANAPKLFLETITLKSLDAESFRPLIAGMCSEYGCISIDKNSNTLIIYDTKEALAKIMELVPQKEIVTENLVHRSYRIVYANVNEIEKTLKTFISKSGSLSANPSTSNILVVDFESNIKVIDNFIKEIDRITPQILVEARIYDVTSTEGFDIGAEWEAGRNTDVTDITRENTHTRTDTADSGENYYEREQVWDAVTSTYTTDETTWNYEDPTTSYATTDTDTITKESTGRRSKPFVTGTFDKDTGGTITFGLLNDAVDIELALNILHSQVSAKLLANPRILVLDNETAEFEIVSEIPYTQQSETSAGGGMTSIQFKKVGVELKVTPHVTRDGMVRLHIIPEFGVVTKEGETTSTGVQTVPTVDTRKVDTKALVKDGQTVVIGGLRKRKVSQDIRKIPALGDMPLLGGLFRDESESIKTTELLIFITPRIIIEPTLSPSEQEQLRDTEFPTPKKPTPWIERNSE